VEQI
jgi:hypothetical protein